MTHIVVRSSFVLTLVLATAGVVAATRTADAFPLPPWQVCVMQGIEDCAEIYGDPNEPWEGWLFPEEDEEPVTGPAGGGVKTPEECNSDAEDANNESEQQHNRCIARIDTLCTTAGYEIDPACYTRQELNCHNARLSRRAAIEAARVRCIQRSIAPIQE